ncbi:hypothetical protein HPULCUR_005544 [Helicostylum pulchrum]|uniref:F-box domain-containing protein n=1 Tax=Helicostylum pulchrum TaxID=562976 RepID=A0ABP9XZD5_9FUNG
MIRDWFDPKLSELKNVRRCIFVCKSWRASAEPVFYTNFTTHNRYKFQKFLKCMKEYPHLSKHVKHISIDKSLNIKELTEMALAFPNLESLSAEANRKFYMGLVQIPEEIQWKNFGSVPNPDRTKDISVYVDCVLKYSSTFTSLILADKILLGPGETEDDFGRVSSRIVASGKAQFERLRENLHLFRILKSLYIADRHSDKSFEFYDDILEKCPTLEKVDFEIRPITASKKSTLSIGPINIDAIQPREGIREIMVEGPLLYNDNSLRYVMRKFPNLRKIYLNRVEQFYKEKKSLNKIVAASKNFSLDVVSDFFVYVENIPKHHLGLFKTELNIAQCMKQFIQKRGSDRMLSPLIIRQSVKEGSTYLADIEITNCSEFRGHYNKDDMVISLQDVPTGLVLPELIKECGCYLTKLDLVLSFSELDNIATNEQYTEAYLFLTGYFLDRVFTHCSNLTVLTVKGARLIQCDPQLSTNNSITRFCLANTDIHPEVFPQISARLTALKSLQLNSCGFKGMVLKGAGNCPYIEVVMPDTNLELLDIGHGFKSMSLPKLEFLYIKAVTKRKSKGRYLRIQSVVDGTGNSLIEKITEEQFLQSLEVPGGAFYYFKFRALKMINVLQWSSAGRMAGKIRLESNQ